MADNTRLNPGTGGDLVRSIDRSGTGPVTQVTQLDVGGAGASESLVSQSNPLPTSLNATIFRFSTNNTSTAQLAASATFTGVIETAQDQPSISLLLTSDQPITLTVRQFIDSGGTRAVPDIVFFVAANTGFARSFTLNGNFVQVLAQNTGVATTTTFSLNTAYGTLGDSDSTGIMPVSELPLILAGQGAQTAVVNNILTTTAGTAPVNVAGYRAASVQVVSTGTAGTFIFEQSNDGTNWVALPVFNAALVTGVPITAAITATASSIIYSFPVRCTFVRLRIATTITGGSLQAFSRFSTEPWTTPVQLVASSAAANLQATVSGTVTANIGTGSIAAGANAIGDVGLQVRTNATGAVSVSKIASAATTNATSVKATAGRVFGWHLTNTTAAVKVVRLYNLAVAPTVGTSVPVYNIVIPANGHVSESFPIGIGHATGISYAITNALPDLDATAVAANDVIGAIYFA